MGHCALAWPCPPEGLLFPTVSGTGLQEASDTASLLRSEILAAGILFSPISLIPGTAPPLRPQPNRSGLLSLPCLYGRAGDNAQASRERRLSGGVQRQLSAWERSDRGRSGPRWAGVTQVTRLHRRSKECAGAWTVGLQWERSYKHWWEWTADSGQGADVPGAAVIPSGSLGPPLSFYVCNLNTGAILAILAGLPVSVNSFIICRCALGGVCVFGGGGPQALFLALEAVKCND